jgi:serine O-acetyltransferase
MDAIQWQQLSYKLYKRKIKFIPNLISRWIHIRYNCDLQPITPIGEGTKLGHRGIGVVIHPRAKIGRYCLLAQNISIAGKDGGVPELGDYVYVGHASIVMGGIKVGNNAFIGALSLVNKDVPDNAIVAGIPAKVIKIKTPEEVEDWHRWIHGK